MIESVIAPPAQSIDPNSERDPTMAKIEKSTGILVVDDASTMRITLKNMLQTFGFESVLDTSSAKEATSLLEKSGNSIGLILSDYNMPEVNGLQFLAQIRQNPLFKETPFIMITAEGEKRVMIEAIKLGVTQYLIKPIRPEELARKIESIE
jgi:two-component system chemotaxis response regulator CheY